MNKATKSLLVLTTAGVTVLGGGTVALAGEHTGTVQKTVVKTATTVSAAQAVAAAQKVVKGKVESVTLGSYQSRTVWKVEILASSGAWREVLVDATTGKVLTHRARKANTAKAGLVKQTRITLAEAVGRALKSRPGTVTRADLVKDAGGRTLHWKIWVKDTSGIHILKVNASNGTITP